MRNKWGDEVIYLSLAALELVKESFVLETGVEFRRIVHDEDDVSSVNEPLDDIIERIGTIDLLADLENARDFDNVYLSDHSVTGGKA